MKKLGKLSVMAIIIFMFTLPTLLWAGETFNSVKKKGFVTVGVNGSLFGFGQPDAKGAWKGLDVDTGRAVAAAVFGDASKAKFIPLTAVQRFTALQSGEIDILCRNATRTLSRDTSLGLNFATVNYYDGQGFMVSKKLGVKSAKELDGATICVLPGTTTEQNAADFFRSHGLKWKPVVIEQTAELAKAFFAGRCDCLTSDASQLAGARAKPLRIRMITLSCRTSSRKSLWPRQCDTAMINGVTLLIIPFWR